MSNYKDGRCGTREYSSYNSMINRCYNQNDPKYHRYGGRGIKVCDAWQWYNNFLIDMGERPEGMTLDRIDNDGDYTPDNCKWSTAKEQANNRHNRRDKKPRVNSKTNVIHVSARKNGGYDVRVGRGFRFYTHDFDEACRVAKEARLRIYGDVV